MGEKPLSVAIASIVNQGKILLIKRVKEPYAGFWSLPGGKIEYGEHIEEAVLREVEEETGLQAKVSKLLAVVSEHIFEDDKISNHFLLFVCELVAGNYTHTQKSEGEVSWFDLESIDSKQGEIIPSDFRMVKDIVIGKKGNYFTSVIENNENGYEIKSFEAI